jgi:acyl-CoA synthetase (AMP-forming)/AMP-acid ligase II
MSLGDLLFDPESDGDAAFVHAGGLTYSRAEMQALAGSIARALEHVGVTASQPVGVMLPNGAPLIGALFGVWRAGSVYVPVNPRYTPAEIDHLRASVEPAAVVTLERYAHLFEPLPVVTVDDDVTITSGDVGTKIVDPDIAFIQFTSGTTGKPKPVLLRHSNVLELLDGVLATIRGGREASAKPPMPNLVPVSLSLWAGIYQVLFAARVGAPVVVMDGFDTMEFARLVEAFDIRSTVLPPAAMAMLADDARVTSLVPLRYVRSITAPLSPFQARRFNERFGIAVLNSYGQTEIGGEIVGWSAADSREFGASKLGAVGRPHRGVDIRVVDAEGVPLATDESGELWVKTPSMSAGYADGSSLSDRLSADGYFRTGDIARIDEDSFVWIEGRVSDMINRGGLKVYPGEVEEVLRTSRAVADVAVVGVPDDRLGEVPWAFTVMADGATLDTAALQALAREHLLPYKIPVQFVALDALPLNDVGKVLKRSLIETAVARLVGP